MNYAGAANGMKIMVGGDGSGDTDGTGLSQLAFDPTLTKFDPMVNGSGGKNMTQIMAAEDAKLIVDGLEVTKSSNTITDVVSGTTINLLKANTGSPTKVISNPALTNNVVTVKTKPRMPSGSPMSA